MVDPVMPCVASHQSCTDGASCKTTIPATPNPVELLPVAHVYEIENSKTSESAYLLFARDTTDNERVVIKLLRAYKDTRYSLEYLPERQQCQLEALRWNSLFTPQIYLGIAGVCSFSPDEKKISIGEMMTVPIKEKLLPNVEYALLMKELPATQQLEALLKQGSASELEKYSQLLVQRIVKMHATLPMPSSADYNGHQWGSFTQLYEKLKHNLVLLELISSEESISYAYTLLKEALLQEIMRERYEKSFTERVKQGHIKRCHGDLKTSNIWIVATDATCHQASENCVFILDTIDFNAMYSNIDVLSDLALLIVDIQARRSRTQLANAIKDHYFQLSGQQDEFAKLVLAYYVVEKAVMSAAVSIIYDKQYSLGLSFLKVAEERMQELKSI